MTDLVYQKFVRRWQEVTDLPPQNLGRLTPHYKWLAHCLKAMPWPIFLLLSLILVIGLYLLLGSAITLLVSLLQRGF